jgi:stage III sporulation protein SpoIIIAA
MIMRSGYQMPGKEITDDLDLLLQVLPPHLTTALRIQPDFKNLVEVVLDLGRHPEARFPDRAIYLTDTSITLEDLDYVTHRVGAFTEDNRAGIERTLHRYLRYSQSAESDYRTDVPRRQGSLWHGRRPSRRD